MDSSDDTADRTWGWELAVSGDLKRTEPPAPSELEVLRRLAAPR